MLVDSEQVFRIPIYQMFRAQDAQAEKSSPTAAPSGILPSGIFPAMPVVRHVSMSLLPQLTLLRPWQPFLRILQGFYFLPWSWRANMSFLELPQIWPVDGSPSCLENIRKEMRVSFTGIGARRWSACCLLGGTRKMECSSFLGRECPKSLGRLRGL